MLPWHKLEKSMYRLQKRIYRAAERGNVHIVHNLQRKLMKSAAASLLAVRKVTQDNQGKKTAGVDGEHLSPLPNGWTWLPQFTPSNEASESKAG